MSLRLGALLCLSGLVACSHNASETAKDPSYANEHAQASNDPAMKPASLENASTSPPTTPTPSVEGGPDAHAPLVADTHGTGHDDLKAGAPNTSSSRPSEPAKSADTTAGSVQPDNTKKNERDRNSAALTPMDQSNSEGDLKITQQIRQAVMADGSLSFTAKNVKIITQKGRVTLRGPVKTEQERSAIDAAARKVAGTTEVDNQIEVKK
jgi:hyperosmotically inducible protein